MPAVKHFYDAVAAMPRQGSKRYEEMKIGDRLESIHVVTRWPDVANPAQPNNPTSWPEKRVYILRYVSVDRLRVCTIRGGATFDIHRMNLRVVSE